MRQPKQGWKKWGVTAMLALALALTGCGNDKKDNDEGAAGNDQKTVAVYEGGTITEKEFAAYEGASRLFNPYYDQLLQMDPTFRESVLKQKIAIETIYEKASEDIKKQEQDVSEEDFKSFKEGMTTSVGGEEQWDELLKGLSIDEDDLKDYIVKSNTVRSHFLSQADDAAKQKKYEQMAAEHQFDVASVRHILIATKDSATQEVLRTMEEALARANEVKQKLDEGADFATLVTEYSDDPGSKNSGGLYENANVNNWVEGFKDAALTLPLNTVSDPVETEYGYHVMRVEKRETQPYDQVKDAVESSVIQDQFGSYMDNELPGLIKEITLPQAAAEEPTASPEASPEATPAE